MKKTSFQLVILILIIAGCKTKTENNDRRKTPNTVQSSNNKNETSKIVRLKAKPDSLVIDAAKTAVIVVDMTNDFGAKGGMFDRAGTNISGIQKVVKPTKNVLDAAREAGIKIIYLKMAYLPDLSDLGEEGSPNRVQNLLYMHVGDTMLAPNGSKSRILIRENWGTEILPELKPQTDDIVIYKTRFSGFYRTELDDILKRLEKKYLIVVGCTTSVCVESTVRDAMFRDYFPIVLEDCTAEPIGSEFPRSNYDASILLIQEAQFGWVSNSEEFIHSIKAQPMSGS